ncbi:biofilm development YmgB/AriR family protein (plasmid) [Escherichia coli]|nr:biofilm development YmgB/AriR family protein [Escherichia coli]EFB3864515.1 biofilm development YmgB/AriR family protein [Escherichia coli]EKM5305692.1 biofilm development YmgB/AriR family protein [Escherichia coli]ELO3128899.1 biofilm development YmgB/AriR family protein [Escherichia coli]ELO3196695.1 biofilm development YmgB/AriR family protein [Escherichia coli]
MNSDHVKMVLDKQLSNILYCNNDSFPDERMMIEKAVDMLSKEKLRISNKNILIKLESILSCSNSPLEKDIIRSTLELIFNITSENT